jgi:hypothetical protein
MTASSLAKSIDYKGALLMALLTVIRGIEHTHCHIARFQASKDDSSSCISVGCFCSTNHHIAMYISHPSTFEWYRHLCLLHRLFRRSRACASGHHNISPSTATSYLQPQQLTHKLQFAMADSLHTAATQRL